MAEKSDREDNIMPDNFPRAELLQVPIKIGWVTVREKRYIEPTNYDKHYLKPVLSDLFLAFLCDKLLKQAMSVPQTITPSRQVEGGHGIQEARGESPQTTISQSCIFLLELPKHKSSNNSNGEIKKNLSVSQSTCSAISSSS